MNRSRGILASLRLANSVLSTRLSSAPSVSTQVTRFSSSHLSFQPRSPLLTNAHQSLYFSTKPNSLLQLILTNDWSDELETALDEFNSVLTHETIIYVLKKLDKDPKKASRFFNWARQENGFSPNSSVFSTLLKILANKATMKEFWVTLREMKELGFYLDEETYQTIHSCFTNDKMAGEFVALTHFYERMVEENAKHGIARKVAEVILRDEQGNEIEKELDGMNIDLSDNLVIRVLKELKNYPKKGVMFFHWAGKCSSYKHNTVTYNALLRVLARHDSIAEFWSVVEEMKGEGFEVDIETYIKISRNFHKKFRMLEDAVKLYELMMDGPYKPSEQHCCLLLRSISGDTQSLSLDLSLVFRVVNKYEAAGYSLSKSIYDGIHRSLTKLGKFDEAAKIMDTMKNAGYEPDNITYSQLVYGLCRARRLEEACKVLDEMEANGCFPDIKTWTILIKGHCDANQIDGALMCFSKMLKNFEADADLLDVLVNGYVSQNQIELVEMVNVVHSRPWQATFKLIENLLGKRELKKSMNLLKLMKKQNYPPYPEPFIRYISKSGTVDDAKEFLKALSVKEYPRIGAYITVLKSFLEEGRHSEAQDLLYKCPHHIRNHPKVSGLFGTKSTA